MVVEGEMVNPFALGHKINHPPKGISPNVILIDLIIPNHFFTMDYLRYLPNAKFTTEKVLIIINYLSICVLNSYSFRRIIENLKNIFIMIVFIALGSLQLK